MAKEAEPIIKHFKNASEEFICDKRVICGKLFGERAGIVICGVGKVNAASGAQLAIDRLGASTIINLGVAGGLNKTVNVGDIYSISSAVQYDFDLTKLNGTAIGTLDEFNENYLPLSVSKMYAVKKLATGDRFNDDSADYKLIAKKLGADIRDMEGGAIAQVCLHADVKCYAFKIISDIAGSGSTIEQYTNNLSLCFKTLERELKNIFSLGIHNRVLGKD